MNDEFPRISGERFYIVSCLREVDGREQTDRALGYEILRKVSIAEAEKRYKEQIAVLRSKRVCGRVMFEVGTTQGGETITLFSLGNTYVGAKRRQSRMYLSVMEAEKGKEL